MPYKDPERRRANQRERNRRWRQRHPEKVKEQWRKWRETNLEYDRERCLRYRRENIVELREYQAEAARKWRAENPGYSKRVYAANPDRLRAKDARRRALKMQSFVEDVDPLVVLERDDGMCGICDKDVDPLDFHVDHVIPLARGGEHSYANTQVAHPRCNQRKSSSLTV